MTIATRTGGPESVTGDPLLAVGVQHQLDEQRKKVDVDYFDVTVREVIRMVAEDELRTAPDYQRKFRWSSNDESRLIESLFLGLPVPSIFVATNRDGTWEVVDGLQRVSTIVHFAATEPDILQKIGKRDVLQLGELSKLDMLAGKTFDDLGTSLKLAFNKRMVRVTALSDKSDLDVRFDLFERLNTGGIALTPQEVRACVIRGDFLDMVETQAQNTDFQSLLKLQKSNQEDGTREEIVLKTFAYMYDRENFDGKVKAFLNKFAADKARAYELGELAQQFKTAVKLLRDAVAGPIVPTRVSTTPVNELEGILVAAVELTREGHDLLTPKTGWLDDTELVSNSTKGTNTKAMLNGRIKRARELLLGADVKLPATETA